MANRRKNPDSAGFYIALAAGGALLYLLFRNGGGGGPSFETLPLTDGGGGGGGGGSDTRFMPEAEARQLQTNINTFRNMTGAGSPIAVDGKFGPQSYAALTDLRAKAAPRAEAVRASGGASDFDFLKDPTIFYDPTSSDSVTFRLYGSTQEVVLRDSLYNALGRAAISISAPDLRALRS